MERKSTSEFSERQNLMIHNFRLQSGSENYSTTYEELKVKSDDDAARQFMAPAICSLCALSIEAVSSSVNLNHSQLLLTMVRLYADISLIQAVFSCLESNYLYLIKEYRGEKILKKKLLIICTILTKAARIEKGVVEHTKFTENIVESIILLLQFELVDCTSAALFLSEIMKVMDSFSCIDHVLWLMCSLYGSCVPHMSPLYRSHVPCMGPVLYLSVNYCGVGILIGSGIRDQVSIIWNDRHPSIKYSLPRISPHLPPHFILSSPLPTNALLYLFKLIFTVFSVWISTFLRKGNDNII